MQNISERDFESSEHWTLEKDGERRGFIRVRESEGRGRSGGSRGDDGDEEGVRRRRR